MLCLHDSRRHNDPAVQRRRRAVEDAPSLAAFILAAWQVARVLTVHLVEAVLAERARHPTLGPRGPQCGAGGRSKGFAKRPITSLGGPIQWRRRVGRCPRGCETPPVAPLDEALGVQPQPRTRGELPSLGGAWAVFVPFATAARLLGWYRGGPVSPQAGWGWGQAAGQHVMETLQEHFHALAQGDLPTPEALAADLAAAPLVVGADGVRGPLRPTGGQPTGKTRGHEVKGGGPAWASIARAPAKSSPSAASGGWWRSGGISMRSSRVWGLKPCARASARPPRESGSVMVRGAGGGCMRSGWRPLPWASWTFTTPCRTSGRGRQPGSTAARPRHVGGLAGHGTGCGRASRTGAWQTLSRPGRSRACRTPHGRL